MTQIRLKRGTTVPLAGDLVTGELAINTDTGTVYTKKDDGTVVAISGGGGGGGIPDVPTDGKSYVRKNGGWSETAINDYDNGITYSVGDQVIYGNVIYKMTSYIGGAGYDPVAYPSNWTAISGPAGAAGTNGTNGTNGIDGLMNYLDVATVTSSSAGLYVSAGYWMVYYGFMNTSSGWFYNKLNGSGVTFKFYINGVYDSMVVGPYNYYAAGNYAVATLNTGDIMTVFVSDGTNDATIPLVTATY